MASRAHHIALEGNLGLRDVGQLAEQLRDALAKHKSVRIATKDLTGIDISVLQLVVSARKTAEATGVSLALAEPAGGALRDLLIKTGFLDADGGKLTAEGGFWTEPAKEGKAA